MENLFDEVITFTDIHLGMKHNSTDHNLDCVAFVKDMIKTAKERNITKCIFMGDFFHNRSAINISTLNFGLEILDMLNEYFTDTWFLVGNHDMYHKNRRDITSINMARSYDNIHFINEITTVQGCTFIPFMVGDEYKQISALTSKYVFGHLELPGYLLNKMTQMPDHGKETEDSFSGCEYVFSGHFHKRQIKETKSGTKVVYTGNCFPHNFSDAWDDARGYMVLKWDHEPEFIQWMDAPKYRTFKFTDMMQDPEYYLSKGTIAKVEIDAVLSMEEMTFMRKMFTEVFELRELALIPAKHDISSGDVASIAKEFSTASIDEIVIAQINLLDSTTLDKELLISIYNSL